MSNNEEKSDDENQTSLYETSKKIVETIEEAIADVFCGPELAHSSENIGQTEQLGSEKEDDRMGNVMSGTQDDCGSDSAVEAALQAAK